MLSEKPRLALVPSEGWRGRLRGGERERERIRPRAFSDLFASHEQGEICVRSSHVRGPSGRKRSIKAAGSGWRAMLALKVVSVTVTTRPGV